VKLKVPLLLLYRHRCILTFEVEFSRDGEDFHRINTQRSIFTSYVYSPGSVAARLVRVARGRFPHDWPSGPSWSPLSSRPSQSAWPLFLGAFNQGLIASYMALIGHTWAEPMRGPGWGRSFLDTTGAAVPHHASAAMWGMAQGSGHHSRNPLNTSYAYSPGSNRLSTSSYACSLIRNPLSTLNHLLRINTDYRSPHADRLQIGMVTFQLVDYYCIFVSFSRDF